VGEVLEKGIPGVVGIIGIVQAFGLIQHWAWGVGAAGLLALELVVVRFRRGSALRALLDRFSTATGEYAGQLDTILVRLSRSPTRAFSENASKTLCTGLLSQLRDFAAIAFGVGGEGKLRATLAVPLRSEQGDVTAVRVWAYDRPYPERRWTLLPLGLVGAPRAFELGRIEIIPDIHRVAGIKDAEQRPYRSVLSIPVKAGGPEGATLAVVSLDSGLPHFFERESVVQKLVPLALPLVNTIALVLALRRPGEAYEFEQ
jgi:GAF domain-containing protein